MYPDTLLLRNKRLIKLPLFISFLCYAILCYLFPHGELTRTYDYGMIRCLGGFFTGVALFGFYSIKQIKITNNKLLSFLEIIVLLMIFYFVSKSYHSLINELFVFISFVMALFLFSSQQEGMISKVFSTEPMQLIGRLSYSIYMVHAIVVVSVQNIFERYFHFEAKEIIFDKGEHISAIITKWAYLFDFTELVIVIILSYLTYKFIELPWRNKFRNYAKVRMPYNLETKN